MSRWIKKRDEASQTDKGKKEKKIHLDKMKELEKNLPIKPLQKKCGNYTQLTPATQYYTKDGLERIEKIIEQVLVDYLIQNCKMCKTATILDYYGGNMVLGIVANIKQQTNNFSIQQEICPSTECDKPAYNFDGTFGGGWGIIQWTCDRRANFQQWHPFSTDIETQAKFLLEEMEDDKNWKNGKNEFIYNSYNQTVAIDYFRTNFLGQNGLPKLEDGGMMKSHLSQIGTKIMKVHGAKLNKINDNHNHWCKKLGEFDGKPDWEFQEYKKDNNYIKHPARIEKGYTIDKTNKRYTGDKVQDVMVKYLIDNCSFCKDQPNGGYMIAGIVGNIVHESQNFQHQQEMCPTDDECKWEDYKVWTKNGGGWGLVQWTCGRRRAFDYQQIKDKSDKYNIQAQTKYLLIEMQKGIKNGRYTPDEKWYWKNGHIEGYQKNSTSVEDATNAYCIDYLNPSTPHLKSRKEYAAAVWKRHKDILEPMNVSGKRRLEVMEEANEPLADSSIYQCLEQCSGSNIVDVSSFTECVDSCQAADSSSFGSNLAFFSIGAVVALGAFYLYKMRKRSQKL